MQKYKRRGSHEPNSGVVSEQDFSAALSFECRRTERSDRPFFLMLASLKRISANENEVECFEHLASALSIASRETDTIGWYRQDEVLGVIFTELGTARKDAALACLKQKVNAALDAIAMTNDRVTLSFRCFPDHDGTRTPWLRAELHRKKNARIVERAVKRVIDTTGSALGLVVLTPLFLAIGLLIKLTSQGPVLFRQSRLGQHGKEFTFLKFRSMYVNSNATLHKEYVSHFIAGKAGMKESADRKTSAYKVIDDPRVTPLGRVLRKTSLDELPQLLNVLKGEMSLVGPRPPLAYECACYDIWHLRRIVEVKPGITGLWQVYGRSRTSFDEMVRLDLRYAKKWSLALDFMILLMTFRVVLSGDGAY